MVFCPNPNSLNRRSLFQLRRAQMISFKMYVLCVDTIIYQMVKVYTQIGGCETLFRPCTSRFNMLHVYSVTNKKYTVCTHGLQLIFLLLHRMVLVKMRNVVTKTDLSIEADQHRRYIDCLIGFISG